MHKEMIPKGALEVKQILERQLNRESSLDRRNQPTIPTEK